MPDGQLRLREVAWQDICPWLLLVRPFRLAIRFPVLVLATAGILAAQAGWDVVGMLFSQSSSPLVQKTIAQQALGPWEVATSVDGWHAVDPMSYERLGRVGKWIAQGPIVGVWKSLSEPFHLLFHQGLTFVGLCYLSLGCLWTALVWGLFGGAITRIAVLAMAREEQLGMRGAVSYARDRIGSYFVAPLIPLGGVAVLMIPLAVLGLIMRLGLGVLLAGMVFPLVLVAGVVAAILLVGLCFGWPLMGPTISSEGTDSFDALSRSYAYVYQRPLYLGFCVLVAVGIGMAGAWLVDVFAGTLLHFTGYALSWGLGEQRWAELVPSAGPEAAGVLTRAGAWLIAFWQGAITALQAGFRYAFFWCSVAAIYLLLRRSVDATEMEEVFLLSQPERYGLPPLEEDVAGVPGAADIAAEPEGENLAAR